MSLDETGRLPQPSDIRKIVVFRAGGLGDFIFGLPALQALRDAYPDADIALAALPWHRELLMSRPSPIDRVIVIPDEWERAGTERASFLELMQAERFDLAVQMHGGGRTSNPFVRALGARHTIGWQDVDAEPLDRSMRYVYFQSEVFRCLELVRLAGAHPQSIEPHLEVTPTDLGEATGVRPSIGGRLVALHPGAGDGRRRWPWQHFAELTQMLAREGMQVILVGSEQDRPLADAIGSASGSSAIDLTGRLSLGGLAGLFTQCAVMVGNDSGPVHLAEAAGTPTVGIYWCGNLINAGPVWRTWHRPLLSWRLDCPECGANCLKQHCDHRSTFVADVSVDAVANEVRDLLQQRETAAAATSHRLSERNT